MITDADIDLPDEDNSDSDDLEPVSHMASTDSLLPKRFQSPWTPLLRAWDFHPLFNQLIVFYGDKGDVQMFGK